MAITKQDIESELSYAYLHAVASHAGFVCEVSGRLSDKQGIDARLGVYEVFPNGILTDFSIQVQLKATVKTPAISTDGISFGKLSIDQYDDLRSTSLESQRILVVLFLPEAPEEWLRCTEQELILKRCAYWVSLRGAPPSTNPVSQTVYLPVGNILSAGALRDIASRVSRGEEITYVV